MKKSLRVILGSLGLLLALLTTAVSAESARTTRVGGGEELPNLDGLPLSFAENRGQWPAATLFSGSVPGASLSFTDDGMTCMLTRRNETADAGPRGLAPDLETMALRVTFPGSRTAAISGEAPAAHLSHYYPGNDPGAWRTNVRNFGAVRYTGIYPGVDLVYHGRGGEMEYDFEVAPGADWRVIRVHYDGVERLDVTPAGDLSVTTRFGRVTERAPVAWQSSGRDSRPVRVSYRLFADNTFGFDVLDDLDPSSSLVIDPVLHYGTYLGGSSYDEPHGIDANAAGEAWVVGGTLSPDFPATGSPVPSTNYSVFVTRLAANGQSLLWSVFLGGSEDQIGYGIDVDPFDNAFISGTTGSNDFPTTAGCYDATFNGTNPGELDMFVAKLSPAGTLLYSTYLGGPDSDTNSALALASTGQVYVCGNAGTNFPTTAGCYDATSNGAADVVLSVLSTAGLGPADLVYSTYLGGNDYDECHGIALDVTNNAYIAGATRSPDFPAGGGPPFNGTFDAFLAQIQPAGNGPADLLYNEKFGGAGQDYGKAVAADFIGVGFTGITTSANYPVTGGAYQTTYGGGSSDAFVMFLLPSVNFVFYSTFLGGAGAEFPAALHMTFGGAITVIGATNSPAFPTTAGSYDPTYNGGFDMFISGFDQSGANLLKSTFLGGSQDDIPYSFKIDLIERIYLTGTTMSSDFPTTPTADDTSYGGGAIDGVVVKFQPDHPESCAACASPPDTCCAKAPRFQGAPSPPSLSQHLLVGTREEGMISPYAVTVFDLGSPAPTEDVEWSTILRYNGPGTGWRADSLGSVFGLTVDEYGNIFVTHASCYDVDQVGQIAGAGPGAVYRIDAVTGVMNTFCRLPNYPDPNILSGINLPGLGNITYDCRHRQFFVTNLEDGRIYRIKSNGVNGITGTIQEVFDPGVQDLGPTNYLTPIGSVPSPGWAPLGERLWGVQCHMGRVFYGLWIEDIGAPSASLSNEVRSVALTAAGAFNAGSDQHELFLPPMPAVDYSMPVADISFDAGGKMLLGERGISGSTFNSSHMARNLEYLCEAGCWVSANLYQLGVCCVGANAGGGVDYDSFPYTGGPIGRVWGTAEAIHLGYPNGAEIFGYQGSRPTGGSNITGIIIDDDGNTLDLDKSWLGDVEAPGCVDNLTGEVCGKKFHDLNHNGVQDNGEPGLLGWSIVLNGPGGPYTAFTDEQGNYCFEDVAPGNYTLTEVTLPGWIQTAPPGGAFQFTLTSGQTLGGRDFGNYFCTNAPPCVTPPPSMAAWWTFDEAGGSPAADAAHLDPARNALSLFGGATFASGLVGNALQLSGPAAHASTPHVEQLGLDFGDGSFALDAWLNVNASLESPRVIAERRTVISTTPYRTRGWSLYLNGQQLMLEVGTPGLTETFAGPTIPAGMWTHVAVSVDRAAGTGTWFVDGAPVPGIVFSPPAGSVFNTAAVTVGGRVFPGPVFDGLIDELEFFHSTLRAESVAAIVNAAGGKCQEYCRIPGMTSICKDKPTVTICANIVNNTNTSQAYHWTVAGVQAGPGCTVNGPVTFSPSSGSVTVPAGGTSAPICITMTRPAGLIAHNATACFEFSYVNDATGLCRSCTGKIRADNSCWCVTPAQPGVVSVVERVPSPVVIGIKHPCPPIEIIHYSLSAVYEGGDHPDPLAVSLNGLPPGEPVLGQVSLGDDEETEVSVLVSYPNGYDPAGLYRIVMEADTDGDSIPEVVSVTPIASTYEADPVSGVPGDSASPPALLRLTAAPNPFQTGAEIAFTLPAPAEVDLAIFDLSGRLVRALHQGRMEAGAQSVAWDGRDDGGRVAGGGIYFIRLRAGGVQVRVKIVRIR